MPDDIWQMLMDTGSNISLKPDYDFALDSSLQKYVSRHQSFDDKGYKPNDLVKLADNNLVLTQKNMQLRQEAATSL